MDQDQRKLFSETPFINDKVYENLPKILVDACNRFPKGRERDVVLTASLGVLSGLFPNIHGVYDQKKVYSNLFTFIAAPAASNKGSMNWAKSFGNSNHQKLKENYQSEKKAFKEIQKERKSSTNGDEVPKRKFLFIPANISTASLVEALSDSNGSGIVFESEADTLSAVFKNEWGNFSDILRKAYHHEAISIKRKTNNEYYEINLPKLSVVLSGTLSQVQRLIPSIEDGLFSRFTFYVYISEAMWKNVSPFNKITLDETFKKIEQDFKLGAEQIFDREIRFNLSKDQWNNLNHNFDSWLKDFSLHYGAEANSLVLRLGLMAFRLAMLLSILRRLENKNVADIIECEDVDYETAMHLAKTFKIHSLVMFSFLPKENKEQNITQNIKRKLFFDRLPLEFARHEALDIGCQNLKLSQRTVDGYLENLVKMKLLVKSKHGEYSKANF